MGLRAGRDDTVTKSSDDDELNESAATVQRPLPAPRPSQVTPDENPFAAFEDDRVEDDDEGSLPTEALIRPDVKMAEAGIEVDDKVPTAVGHKKIRMPSLPAPLPESRPRIPIIKTPMAMSISTIDETPPLPESGHTRVAPLQPTPHVQAATASLRQAFQHPPLPLLPAMNVMNVMNVKTAKALPPHKVALLVSMVLFAAAMFIVIARAQHAHAMAAAAPPADDAFPPVAVTPVEVTPAPIPVPAPFPVATFQGPIPPPPPTATQAPPQLKPRRTVRAAVRPAIPVHREQ